MNTTHTIKKALATLALSLGVLSPAAAQQVMTVHTQDGVSKIFRIDDLKDVTFGQLETNKYYEADGQMYSINTVVEIMSLEDEEHSRFCVIHDTTKPIDSNTKPDFGFEISNDLIGKELSLDTLSQDELYFYCPAISEKPKDLSGKFKVSKDRLGSTLTISIDAEIDGKVFKASYKGAYTKAYISQNAYRFYGLESGDMSSVFRADNASGTYSEFCFGSLDAATPDGLTSGNYGVIFQLPTSVVKNGGTIDLKANPDAYKLRFIDFPQKKSYLSDEITSGRISFRTVGDKVQFYLEADLKEGVSITADYYGPTIAASSFESIIPAASVENGVRIYDTDGETVTLDTKITSLKVRDKAIGGGQEGLWFYFLPDEDSSTSDQLLVPLVKINKNLVNAGETDLTEAEAYTYAIKYKDFQLQSPDNEWVNVGQKGTIDVKKDGDNYTINLKVYNKYKGPYATGGDGSMLLIQYSGVGTAY